MPIRKIMSNDRRMRRVEYVFLKDNAHYQSPYLVEISKRASTSIEDLDFCKDSIIFPKIEMIRILKMLKEPSVFLEDDRCSMLEKLCDILTTQRDLVEKETYYLQLAVHMMITNKINKSIKITGKPWTRHDSCVRTMILKSINKKHSKMIKKLL